MILSGSPTPYTKEWYHDTRTKNVKEDGKATTGRYVWHQHICVLAFRMSS